MLTSHRPLASTQRPNRGKLWSRWKWHVTGPQPPSWMGVSTSSAVSCARAQAMDSKWRMQLKCTIQIVMNGFNWLRCAPLRSYVRWSLGMDFYLRSQNIQIVRNMSRWKIAGKMWVQLHQGLAHPDHSFKFISDSFSRQRHVRSQCWWRNICGANKFEYAAWKADDWWKEKEMGPIFKIEYELRWFFRKSIDTVPRLNLMIMMHFRSRFAEQQSRRIPDSRTVSAFSYHSLFIYFLFYFHIH